MGEITRMLQDIESGIPGARDELLGLIYNELRERARKKIANERSGLMFGATDLVHEAYIRLLGSSAPLHWNSRNHFFAAAAQAMRRILVDLARERMRLRNGGGQKQMELDEQMAGADASVEELLAIDEILEQLGKVDSQAAELFKHFYFCETTVEEAAELTGIPERTAYRKLKFARTWLRVRVRPE
jgi:RNA polymerase sigma factor (TIGR02999 family)